MNNQTPSNKKPAANKKQTGTTKLQGYTGKARKKYDLGQYKKSGFKDAGTVNGVVQLKTDKYSGDAAKVVSSNLSKKNPGMKFNLTKNK